MTTRENRNRCSRERTASREDRRARLLHVNSACWPQSSSTNLAVFRLAGLRSLPGWRAVEFLLTLDRYKVFPLETELNDLEREHV